MADIAAQLEGALRDRYVIERELGRGGMATVYLARDLRHHRPVALKVLHPELAATLGPERFLREIRVTARLDHPHILPVFDSGEANGLLWYTMPYVEGESLRERLRREGQLPVPEAVQLTREVADALDCAHRQGVIHRDVKPENILLGLGHARVADFGVAWAVEAAGADRLTETGLAVGTPAYMSPEQASGGRVDARSDLYALGVLIYEMLAGEPPFSGPSAQAIIAKRFSDPVPHVRRLRDGVPERLDAAVTKALAKVPADRFQTAPEFARALGTLEERAMRPGGRFRARAVAAVVLVLAIAAVSTLLWRRRPGTEAAATDEQASVAVLPFENLSSDQENEYFSDGMTEELITTLGRVGGLRVAARASSFSFKGKPLDVGEVSRKLNVGAVLDGSVRRAGRRLRVTAELVRARDGARLWAESYDRELQDVFTLQDDLAHAIVSALTPTLVDRLPVPARDGRTRNLEAYDLYLRGRFAWGRRTQQGFDDARRLYQEAIAKDSGFAQAYAGLADIYLVLPNWTPASYPEVLPTAESLAVKALALDSTLAEAHATLGAVLANYHYDWAGAYREITRAIALNPSYPTARRYLAVYYLMPRGQLDEALQATRKAVALDPLSTAMNALLGILLSWTGHSDEAITLFQGLIRADPGFGQGNLYLALASAYLNAGKPREAIATYLEASDAGLLGPALLGAFGYTYGVTGNRPEALRVLHRLEANARQTYVRPTEFALVYLGMGELDSAFAWFRRACMEHDYGGFSFPASPRTRSLRGDPRRDAILRCMRLAGGR